VPIALRNAATPATYQSTSARHPSTDPLQTRQSPPALVATPANQNTPAESASVYPPLSKAPTSSPSLYVNEMINPAATRSAFSTFTLTFPSERLKRPPFPILLRHHLLTTLRQHAKEKR
jgi:hypothetical protein